MFFIKVFVIYFFFFFQAEDGIRDLTVTGVQTCALPISRRALDAGFTEVEVVVSASDTHNRKNVNRSTEQSLDEIAVVIDEVHQRGAACQVIVSTAWGC